jgi:hypothetical protein
MRFAIPCDDPEEYDLEKYADTKTGPLDSLLSLVGILKDAVDAFPKVYANHPAVTKDRAEAYVCLKPSNGYHEFYRVSKSAKGFVVHLCRTPHNVRGGWNASPKDYEEVGRIALVGELPALRQVGELLLKEGANLLEKEGSIYRENWVALDTVSAVFLGLVECYQEAVIGESKKKARLRKERPDSPRIVYARDAGGHHAVGRFCAGLDCCSCDWVPEFRPDHEDDPMRGVVSFALPEPRGSIPQGHAPSGTPLSEANQVLRLLFAALTEHERTLGRRPGKFCDADRRAIVWIETDSSKKVESFVVLHMGSREVWEYFLSDHRFLWPKVEPETRGMHWTPWADPSVQGRYLCCPLEDSHSLYNDEPKDPEGGDMSLSEVALRLSSKSPFGPAGILAIFAEMPLQIVYGRSVDDLQSFNNPRESQ